MKKSLFIGALSALAFSTAILAAPENMVIFNNTNLISNAFVNDKPSPNVLNPYSTITIPWAAVTSLCHGEEPAPPPEPGMTAADPCAFEVYATTDGNDVEQIDVGTITFSLDSGHIIHVDNKAYSYGLRIVALAPGRLELIKEF